MPTEGLNAGTVLLRTQHWHRTAKDRQRPCRYAYGIIDAGTVLLPEPTDYLLLCLQLQFGTDLVLGKHGLDQGDNYKAWGQAFVEGGVMLRRWYGRNRYRTQDGRYGLVTDPSQGLSWSLGTMYIDVSFPWPSSSPWLDILVYRQSNRTGLPSLVPYSCLNWLSLQHLVLYR